ncbi:mechanosensitive channel MscK [Atopomonas sediminilitoris]|uniref:mechanosensitive channel MscK n=1 Tax=Atopomonas sediminilitoris TaxID=2919919 RepID=UPI001F4D94FC|nr:mechanosensitive channel MscK [Atopomonas sediminilitoris]MCJ8170357.1 mechanosensitive channel MscK [Atopomonas sediminilitoris]
MRFLAVLAVLISLQLTPAIAAETLPTRDAVQEQLEKLSERKLPEADEKLVRSALEKSLTVIDELKEYSERRKHLNEQLDSAPKQISNAQREIGRLQEVDSEKLSMRHANHDLATLETLLSEKTSQLSIWQSDLSAANNLLITTQTRPERAQGEVTTAQARLLNVNTQLKSGRNSSRELRPEELQRLTIEKTALEVRSQLNQEELNGNSVLQELASNRRDLLSKRIALTEQEVQILQQQISHKRLAESEAAAAQASTGSSGAPDSLLSKQSRINLQVSEYLIKATTRLNELNRQTQEGKQQLDNLRQVEQALDEQISVLKGSLLLSKILYQQKQALPSLNIDSRLTDEIGDLRLYQFDLGKRRQELSNPDVFIDQLLVNEPPENITPLLRDELQRLISNRRDLLDRLNGELNGLLSQAINLQLIQKDLSRTSGQLKDTLDAQMFWIPSNRPLDWKWLQTVPELFLAEISDLPGIRSLQKAGGSLGDNPWFYLPALALIVLLLQRRRAIKDKLEELKSKVGHYKDDTQLVTPYALLLHALLALPVPVVLICASYLLQQQTGETDPVTARALLEMAGLWWVLAFTRRILGPNKVAERHFRWEPQRVHMIRSKIFLIGCLLFPLTMIVNVAELQPSRLAADVIGIFISLFTFTSLSWLAWQMYRNQPPLLGSHSLHFLAGVTMVCLPLALLVLVFIGYFYTALKLFGLYVLTLVLLGAWVLLEAMFVRGMGLAARRLAYQRAITKRNAPTREGADGSEIIDDHEMDIEQINQQSLRLIRLVLMIAFIFGLYWIWADLLSVINYLETVTLWEYSSETPDGPTLVPISVRDVLGAALVVFITLILGRNLPGLLEVLVLSKLHLKQGSAYAMTTLLSYVITGFGIVTAMSTLGVSWDKLQWLVAALSVGLGFGLQEIFANFVSGLIILFERPVRIGDTVTLGNLSGTVSRIRIRATTITDFDRKEIIVPNKVFVTDQLINWTLTDPVTRVVLNIGVAYGSDLALTKKLLMQATRENSRVLHEPEPQVLFLIFGESTLDHEVRFHVRELGDRLQATDEINRRIDALFREHGIEIAFRQLDIFVKNLKGEERQLVDKQALPPNDTPPNAG